MFFGNLISFFSLMLSFFHDLGMFFLENISTTFGVVFALGVSFYVFNLIRRYLF